MTLSISQKYEWTKHYTKCVSCGRTDIPHKGRGLCKSCHSRERWSKEKDHWNAFRNRRRNGEQYNTIEQRLAYTILHKALRNGTINKGVCEVCGDYEVEGHHSDYSKPLNVQWLCPKHHSWLHMGREERQSRKDLICL